MPPKKSPRTVRPLESDGDGDEGEKVWAPGVPDETRPPRPELSSERPFSSMMPRRHGPPPWGTFAGLLPQFVRAVSPRLGSEAGRASRPPWRNMVSVPLRPFEGVLRASGLAPAAGPGPCAAENPSVTGARGPAPGGELSTRDELSAPSSGYFAV